MNICKKMMKNEFKTIIEAYVDAADNSKSQDRDCICDNSDG